MEKTKVKFYFERKSEDILAVFPKDYYNQSLYGNEILVCYAHIGQHGSCSKGYLRECKRCRDASKFNDLKVELESIGYDLELI